MAHLRSMHARQNRGPVPVPVNPYQQQQQPGAQDHVPMEVEPVPQQPQVDQRKVGRWGTKKTMTTSTKTTTTNQSQVMISEVDPNQVEEGCVSKLGNREEGIIFSLPSPIW